MPSITLTTTVTIDTANIAKVEFRPAGSTSHMGLRDEPQSTLATDELFLEMKDGHKGTIKGEAASVNRALLESAGVTVPVAPQPK